MNAADGLTSVGWRAARPSSAKVQSTTPAVDPGIKVPRVASAGALRRTSFQRTPHPYSTLVSNRTVNADENGQWFYKLLSFLLLLSVVMQHQLILMLSLTTLGVFVR